MKYYAYKQLHGFCFVVELSRNLLIKFCLRHYFVVKIDCFDCKDAMARSFFLRHSVLAVDTLNLLQNLLNNVLKIDSILRSVPIHGSSFVGI